MEPNEKEIKPDKLCVVRTISTARSKIDLCLWKCLNPVIVVKKSLLLFESARMKRHLTAEISILLNLKHENIVSAFGYVHTPTEFALVMEHCSLGSYHQYFIETNYAIIRSEKEATLLAPLKLRIIKEVVCGMEYLHSKAILHLHIKAEHVLLGRDFTAKLSNFGSSKMKLAATMSSQSSIKAPSKEKQESSALLYTAPEHLADLRQNKPNNKSDVYAFGVLAWQMMTDLKPYDCQCTQLDAVKLVDDIKTKDLRPSIGEIPKCFPRVLVEIVGNSWSADAAQRPEFHQIRDKMEFIVCVENFSQSTKEAIIAANQLLEPPKWGEVVKTLPVQAGVFRIRYGCYYITVVIAQTLRGITPGYLCDATDVETGTRETIDFHVTPFSASKNTVIKLITTMVRKGIYQRPNDLTI